MLNKLIIYTAAVMFANIVSCSSIQSRNSNSKKNEVLNLKDYLNISNAEKEPIQNIAVSIIGRSKAEVESIQDYINFNKIKPITSNKIVIPGDGSSGTFLIERMISDGEVWFDVKESGIEDESGAYKTSLWKLHSGSWIVRKVS